MWFMYAIAADNAVCSAVTISATCTV